MEHERNIITIYDDETREYIGEITPSGGRIEDIEEVCKAYYKLRTIKIMEVSWPGYHGLDIYIKGEKS